jgi:hypothetical protein
MGPYITKWAAYSWHGLTWVQKTSKSPRNVFLTLCMLRCPAKFVADGEINFELLYSCYCSFTDILNFYSYKVEFVLINLNLFCLTAY